MLTYSGLNITPEELRAPSPLDLAIHMGRLTRYGGAIWCPLLFHSFLVAGMVDQEPGVNHQTWAWALLHDAHETVLGEIPYPWKCEHDHPELEWRAIAEGLIDDHIQREYHIPPYDIDHGLIKRCDLAALYVEASVLGPLSSSECYEGIRERTRPGELPAAYFEIARILTRMGFANPVHTTAVRSPVIGAAASIFALLANGQISDAREIVRMRLRTAAVAL